MQSYDISFVIIEYHCIEDVKRCVNSIHEKCKDISYEIIVSSNSTYPPEEQNAILKEFQGVRWIFNKENYGFAKAMNIGISNTSGNSIVIINPDVRLLESLISAYNYLMNNKDVGMIGPKIVDRYENIQDSCRNFVTPEKFFVRVSKRIYSQRDVLLRSNFDYSKIQPVDWVIGAFMMVKRETIKKVGLLDEEYFLYVEDMDWCKRFWDCGLKVVYYPNLVIEYKGDRKSMSPLISRKWANKYTLYHLRSYLRFLRKHGITFKR